MESTEIRRLLALEDTHWWYRERRAILRRELRELGRPGRALDVGAAGGGNTRVLVEAGWDATATDYCETAVEMARERGLKAVCADARSLPFESSSMDLVTAFDVLEHVHDDHLVTEEIARVLAPGGHALIAVPCDMALWSAHDDAVGHVRRYRGESRAEGRSPVELERSAAPDRGPVPAPLQGQRPAQDASAAQRGVVDGGAGRAIPAGQVAQGRDAVPAGEARALIFACVFRKRP
jgi:SAM-dependent methyltransferase